LSSKKILLWSFAASARRGRRIFTLESLESDVIRPTLGIKEVKIHKASAAYQDPVCWDYYTITFVHRSVSQKEKVLVPMELKTGGKRKM
jgi:hypothetical protein